MSIDALRGQYVAVEHGQRAFIPPPPPLRLDYTDELVELLGDASRAVGRLDGLAELGAVNIRLLAAPYMRIEAVLSSRIEGTRTSLDELLAAEAGGKAGAEERDVREVHNYLKALEHGLERLTELPVCARFVRELHEILLDGVRGDRFTPGRFRTGQVFIAAGGRIENAIYVPPPPSYVAELMAEWERYVSEPPTSLSPLIHCGLMHYQFEAIHPFFDGNGRLGRLLIILLLRERGILTHPLLYLSAFFEEHRAEYYERLNAVTRDDDWLGWVAFFLRGVAFQARQAVSACCSLLALREEMRDTVQEAMRTGNGLHLVDMLFKNPYLTVPRVSEKLQIAASSARGLVLSLVELDMLVEAPSEGRIKLYQSPRILRMLEEAARSGDAIGTGTL